MSVVRGRGTLKNLVVILAALWTFAWVTQSHAQSYVEGISVVLDSTTATDLYTFTNTDITYDLAAYYSPYTQAQLLDNGSQVAYGDTYSPDGINAPLYGHVPNLRTGDDYEIDGAHWLIELYYVSDGYGNTYYENPEEYFGVGDSPQPSGYDYAPGGGDYYTVEDDIFLGYTADAISTAVPQISGVSPSSGARGSSGQITISGSHLVDYFEGGTKASITTTSVLSGSGFSLSVASQSAGQIVLNYTLDINATTGAQQFNLTNRFGSSEPQTFTVGDPSPVVNDIEPHIWPAGTVIPLTISGSGFGIAPTVAIGGVGVLTPTPVVTHSTDTSISTSVSIATDAPDGPAVVTVQSHGSGGSGFVQVSPGQPSAGSNTADINANPAPVPQIMFNGQNISGTTQTVMAGQQIALSVPTPNGYTIQSESWSFSNQSAITGGFVNGNGDYGTQPSASAGGSEAADPSLNQNSLTFYWVNPGDNGETVTYTYVLDNGRSASATATFNIGGPTGNLLPNVFVQTDDSATAIVNAQGNPATMKMSNAPGMPTRGIWFNDLAGINNGTFVWVQILNSVTFSQIVPTNSSYVPPSPANTGLDGIYPYPQLTNISTADSPSRPDLLAGMGEAAEKFDATMYILWDPMLPTGCTPAKTDTSTEVYTSTPSNCTSIPVPLAKVHWKWNACTINQLSSSGGIASPSWLTKCGPGQADSPVATGYPQWNACNASEHADCQH